MGWRTTSLQFCGYIQQDRPNNVASTQFRRTKSGDVLTGLSLLAGRLARESRFPLYLSTRRRVQNDNRAQLVGEVFLRGNIWPTAHLLFKPNDASALSDAVFCN